MLSLITQIARVKLVDIIWEKEIWDDESQAA